MADLSKSFLIARPKIAKTDPHFSRAFQRSPEQGFLAVLTKIRTGTFISSIYTGISLHLRINATPTHQPPSPYPGHRRAPSAKESKEITSSHHSQTYMYDLGCTCQPRIPRSANMGLFQRHDSRHKKRVWWISYVRGGKQHRESTGSTNKRVAEKIMASRKAQVVEERWSLPRSHSPRLGDFSKEFLKAKSHAKTRSRYQSSVNNLLRHLGDKVRLSEITPETVFTFQQARLAEGAGKATTNRDVATLSALMSHAKRMRLTSQNPCSDVGKLNERRDRRQAEPFSYEEEARVKQFSAPWLAVLITLLVETGLRVAKEALPLKWSDVFLDSDPAFLYVRDSKSNAGVRTVWLTKHCKDALINWRAMLGPEFSPFVFASPRIAGAHQTDFKTAWRTAARKAGLSGKRIYDLRATLASRANGCRATGLTVAHLLGHESTQILPTYVKPLDENTKTLIEALDVARSSHNSRPIPIQ